MATYQIVGTKEPYTGRVIKIGDQFYTTVGGGIEGDRQQVEAIEALGDSDTLPPALTPDDSVQDVVTTFVVGDNSRFGRNIYYYANGSIVPNGTQLHHHTIPPNGRNNFMTQHVMNGNEQDVFLTPQNTGRRTTQTTMNTQSPTQTQTNTVGGTPTGGTTGGTTGGGTGGMGGY